MDIVGLPRTAFNECIICWCHLYVCGNISSSYQASRIDLIYLDFVSNLGYANGLICKTHHGLSTFLSTWLQSLLPVFKLITAWMKMAKNGHPHRGEIMMRFSRSRVWFSIIYVFLVHLETSYFREGKCIQEANTWTMRGWNKMFMDNHPALASKADTFSRDKSPSSTFGIRRSVICDTELIIYPQICTFGLMLHHSNDPTSSVEPVKSIGCYYRNLYDCLRFQKKCALGQFQPSSDLHLALNNLPEINHHPVHSGQEVALYRTTHPSSGPNLYVWLSAIIFSQQCSSISCKAFQKERRVLLQKRRANAL